MNDTDRSILTYSEAGRAALAEIERLRGELGQARALLGCGSGDTTASRIRSLTAAVTDAAAERDAARAEVERLRALLRDVRPSVEALVSMESREDDDFDALRAIDDALSGTP